MLVLDCGGAQPVEAVVECFAFGLDDAIGVEDNQVSRL